MIMSLKYLIATIIGTSVIAFIMIDTLAELLIFLAFIWSYIGCMHYLGKENREHEKTRLFNKQT